MKLILPVTLFFLFAGCGASNNSTTKETISPTGNLGLLTIASPALPFADSSQYSLSLSRKDGLVKDVEVLFNNVNNLESNIEYCLKIVDAKKTYTINSCGIKLKDGQISVIHTALAQLTADEDQFNVDIGPKVLLKMSSENQLISFSQEQMQNNSWLKQKPTVLLIAKHIGNTNENILIRWANVMALSKDQRALVLDPKSLAIIDITPIDRRVKVNINAPLPLFNRPIYPNSMTTESSFAAIEYVSYLSYYKLPERFRAASPLAQDLNGEYEQRYYYNWIKIPVEEKARTQTTYSYHMYPLTGENKRFYRLVVSGLNFDLSLAMQNNSELNYQVEPLNVNQIELANGKKVPGFYRLFNINNDGTETHLNWINTVSGSPSPDTGSDKQYPTLDRPGNFYPTETTMFVLKGYSYKIASYMYDDNKVLTKQSVHIIDYTAKK